METLAEKWLKDVIGVWLVDTEPRDEYVHCFYVLNYKGDKASYSWKGQNSDRNFEYLEAITTAERAKGRAKTVCEILIISEYVFKAFKTFII